MSSAIEEIISKYITTNYTHSGTDHLVMPCPVHETKTGRPFSVNLLSGRCHCFSCNWNGYISDLLKKLGKVEWQAAREFENRSVNSSPIISSQKDIFASPITLVETCLSIFNFCPSELVRKGFSKQLLQMYDIGYDKYLKRITYPIRDVYGSLIAIVGGSSNPDNYPKYLHYKGEILKHFLRDFYPSNYDELKLKNFLWNGHNVWDKNYESIVVVEGYKACLWVIQCGFPNVVALQGSHLTFVQRETLTKLGKPVVLFLDNDIAGQGTKTVSDDKVELTGTLKIAKQLNKTLPVRLVDWQDLPIGCQPDDCSSEIIAELLNKTRRYPL